MRYTKPFLTPAEQVQLLIQRGMEITDVARAESCLARIGYYRLSAYWYPFRTMVATEAGGTKRADMFCAGTNFTTVHNLYVFDKALRLIVMDGLERIEVSIRTQIALSMGQQSPWAHRDTNRLHDSFTTRERYPGAGQTKYQFWLEGLDRKARESKEDFAKHFRERYEDDPLPIWIAVELWDFGTLSHFYAGMKQADKDRIAKIYGVPPGRIFETWIRCLNDVRNVCAHHSRLFNRAIVSDPRLPAVGTMAEFDHLRVDVHHHTRLYIALLIIRHLLKAINPRTDWKNRLLAHVATLTPNPYVTLASAGFPENWTTLPAWVDPD